MSMEMTPSGPVFPKLLDINPREAWKHEAHDFTVWLAKHLDRLAEPTGMTLELVQTEVTVGDFKADIIARDVNASPEADRVLIENQLEASDHRHLGQILTYLAGAEISTAIWIATQFRDEHLSAVKWLNERTDSGFAFFALRLRAFRIADSPIAPFFEVLAKPNNWERQIKTATPRSAGLSEEGQANGRFWVSYLAAHPQDRALGFKETNLRHQYLEVVPGVIVSVWSSLWNCGSYVRPVETRDAEELAERLAPHMATLQARLGYKQARKGSMFCLKQERGGHGNEADWPKLIEHLHAEAHLYASTIRAVLAEEGTDE